MHRRGFVSILGATILAGCSALGQLGEPLEITDAETESTALGNVIANVTIENTISETHSGTLIGQVDVDGGDTYTESRQITVPGDETNSYRLEFDIDVRDSLSGSQYQFSAEIDQ